MNKEDLRYDANICISGLTASGKTTHCHLLAGEFGLTYVSGSQIQLNFMGVSPIQSKDFWISEEAKELWDEKEFNRIDTELLRLETVTAGYIFDTSTMPWRHREPALCIWLESDLRSRAVKSLVSHRGRGEYPFHEYHERIQDKDRATFELYRDLYGIEVGKNLECFDLILDITSLTTEPTLSASLHSIEETHRIIRPAVGWYLTGLAQFEDEFREAVRERDSLVLRDRVECPVG